MKARTAQTYKAAIQAWGADIYTPINISYSDYWIPTQPLESLLNTGMVGLNLSGLPLRTRAKLVKIAVCEALGYPIPKSFKKTQPRFIGQQLDIYTQKSLNLPIFRPKSLPLGRGCRAVLLLDVLFQDAEWCTSHTSSKVGRRPQRT